MTDDERPTPETMTEFLRKHGKEPAPYEALDGVFDECLAAITAAFTTRVAPLEQRIKQLESRPLLKYAGTHVEGQSYQEAQLVTKAGGLWVSTAPTVTTPGTPGSAWRLVVKKGHAV
jgi:hypothetical protein